MELFPNYNYLVTFNFVFTGNKETLRQDIRVVDKDSLNDMVALVNTVTAKLADKNVPSVSSISLGQLGKTDTILHLRHIAGITFTVHPINGETSKPIRGIPLNQ